MQIWRGIGEVSGGARGAWPEGEGGCWMARYGGEEGLGQECHHLFGCLCNCLHPTNLHPKLPAKCPAKFLGPAREIAREISGACPRNRPQHFWGLPAKMTANLTAKLKTKLKTKCPANCPRIQNTHENAIFALAERPSKILKTFFVFSIMGFRLVSIPTIRGVWRMATRWLRWPAL